MINKLFRTSNETWKLHNNRQSRETAIATKRCNRRAQQLTSNCNRSRQQQAYDHNRWVFVTNEHNDKELQLGKPSSKHAMGKKQKGDHKKREQQMKQLRAQMMLEEHGSDFDIRKLMQSWFCLINWVKYVTC